MGSNMGTSYIMFTTRKSFCKYECIGRTTPDSQRLSYYPRGYRRGLFVAAGSVGGKLGTGQRIIFMSDCALNNSRI